MLPRRLAAGDKRPPYRTRHLPVPPHNGRRPRPRRTLRQVRWDGPNTTLGRRRHWFEAPLWKKASELVAATLPWYFPSADLRAPHRRKRPPPMNPCTPNPMQPCMTALDRDTRCRSRSERCRRRTSTTWGRRTRRRCHRRAASGFRYRCPDPLRGRRNQPSPG